MHITVYCVAVFLSNCTRRTFLSSTQFVYNRMLLLAVMKTAKKKKRVWKAFYWNFMPFHCYSNALFCIILMQISTQPMNMRRAMRDTHEQKHNGKCSAFSKHKFTLAKGNDGSDRQSRKADLLNITHKIQKEKPMVYNNGMGKTSVLMRCSVRCVCVLCVDHTFRMHRLLRAHMERAHDVCVSILIAWFKS